MILSTEGSLKSQMVKFMTVYYVQGARPILLAPNSCYFSNKVLFHTLKCRVVGACRGETPPPKTSQCQ